MDSSGFRFATSEVRLLETLFRAAATVARDATLVAGPDHLLVSALNPSHTCVFEARIGEACEYACSGGEHVLRVHLKNLVAVLAVAATKPGRTEIAYRAGQPDLDVTLGDESSFTLHLDEGDAEVMRVPDAEPDYVASFADASHLAGDLRALSDRERDKGRTARNEFGKRVRSEGCPGVDEFTLACEPGRLVLSANDRFSTRITYRSGGAVAVRASAAADPRVEVRYPLHAVASLFAAPGLRGPVEVRLSKGYPLVLAYRLGGVGTLCFCAAPRAEGTEE